MFFWVQIIDIPACTCDDGILALETSLGSSGSHCDLILELCLYKWDLG